MQYYMVYHDCGKPLCRTVDADGKQHFVNHAAISKQQWLAHADDSPAALEIGELIGMDMDCHTIKPGDAIAIARFAARPQAASLLVAALCELHSNAELFGGTHTDSFKIKFKRLDSIGKKVLQSWL
jgi:hypothetical protein